MDSTSKKLKRKPCTKGSSETKGKTTKKTPKLEGEVKKGGKKIIKSKNQEVMTTGGDNEEEPSSKKRKLQTNPNKIENCHIKELMPRWTDEEYLAESENLSMSVAKNLIELFNKENTIPFIARYRGHLTGHLTPDKLRKIKATYDYIASVHRKAENLIKQVPSNDCAPELVLHIQSARTLEELEFLGSFFKKDSKRSLAQRAKDLGLEPPAKALMEGIGEVVLKDFVKPEVAGLENTDKVILGIQHIIADIISKTPGVHDLLEEIYISKQVLLESKFKSGINSLDKVSSKYQLYGDFSQPINTIQPHQTLAINRGESEKQLSVKIIIPGFIWLPLKNFCHRKWLNMGLDYMLRRRVFNDSVNDAIKRLLEPLACRRIRAKLNGEAENEALNVFGVNLRQLLMTPPCSGHVVMGIDPGFAHGCKLAVVSPTGELLDHGKFYLKKTIESRNKLRSLVLEHCCDLIALGNGTACRETEALLSDFIKKDVFKPFRVSYTIINEQGVSIYSCSSVATEEFPDVDPKVVGAVSLARRLQNPLSELVKLEPKHLGVGMYQHDVGKKKLESTLDEVVSECVSFVGVDVNSASFYLLRRVAGLNAAKAQEIIKFRTEVCTFKCREDLKKVKGIKTKTFQQCAGFIRIIPSTARCTKHSSCGLKFNPLDETSIHPESYEAALKIISRFGLCPKDLGSEAFVEAVKRKKDSMTLAELTNYCKCSTLEVEFIIDSLMKGKDFDLRSVSPGPIFRKGIINLEDLVQGQLLEGVIRNVVSFGAFVDVGVGHNGLIHVSQMRNSSVRLNDRVKVEVMSTNLVPARIELKLLSVIT